MMCRFRRRRWYCRRFRRLALFRCTAVLLGKCGTRLSEKPFHRRGWDRLYVYIMEVSLLHIELLAVFCLSSRRVSLLFSRRNETSFASFWGTASLT